MSLFSQLTFGLSSYNLPALQAFLSARPSSYRTHPRMFDTECLHTPYLPPAATTSSLRSPALKPAAPNHVPEADLLNLTGSSGPQPPTSPRRRTGFSKRPGGKRQSPAEEEPVTDNDNDEEFEEEEWVPDVFMFEYGTVVIWGMTEKEEKTFLKNL